MKKLRLFTTVAFAAGTLLAGHTAVSAQTIGFKVGPTFSKLHSSDSGDNEGVKSYTSFGGGGFVRFGMAGLAMQGEALVVTKGAKITESSDEVSTKLTYLEVPVLARFSMGTGMSTPYLMVGPTFGFELSCKASVTIGAITDSGNCEADGETADRKKFDVGATGVAGIEFKMGPGALLVEGRYTHGLTNLNDSSTDNTKITNRSFAVMAGYAFTLTH